MYLETHPPIPKCLHVRQQPGPLSVTIERHSEPWEALPSVVWLDPRDYRLVVPKIIDGILELSTEDPVGQGRYWIAVHPGYFCEWLVRLEVYISQERKS